ncbi:hypothetical protein JVU11DRAFT_8873 [Chiua virens]|nr:hypothetical protein JVU11DRAFT_8873 [Chiua virens]
MMPHLNKTNYLTWHICMCVLLIRANLSHQPKAATDITLYVNDSKIIHVQGNDPKVILDALASVHHTCSLSTQLAARQKFSCMEKHLEQTITS